MKIRDRIKSLRRVKASDLAPNPRNWRTHSKAQVAAMRGILAEVGYAGAAMARETPDGLLLIDGHLRAELNPDEKIPVLVLDVTEEEADKILATFDPIGSMAGVDAEQLSRLVDATKIQDTALLAMMDTAKKEDRDAGLLTREEIQAAEIEESQPDEEESQPDEIPTASAPPKCPIVPRYAEHYQAFVVVCENTIDEAWLRNRLNLEERQRSHKGETIAKANVITCEQLRGILG